MNVLHIEIAVNDGFPAFPNLPGGNTIERQRVSSFQLHICFRKQRVTAQVLNSKKKMRGGSILILTGVGWVCFSLAWWVFLAHPIPLRCSIVENQCCCGT